MQAAAQKFGSNSSYSKNASLPEDISFDAFKWSIMGGVG